MDARSHTGGTHAETTAPEAGVHRRLAVVPGTPKGVPRWRRWATVGAMVGAITLFGVALRLPWWSFVLYAPQYPHGLRLSISLSGMGGDVHEIDMLNHYIGMGHLADAAPFERAHAAEGVAVVALLLVAVTLLAGRKLGALAAVPAAMFPVGFLADSFYWLHRFGHRLDPHAPLRIPGFTPQLFGNGQIGQFMTFATPDHGFFVALAGVFVAVVATAFRQRAVCARCTRAGTCGALCESAFLGRERVPEEVAS